MSADNWAVCPRCVAGARKARREALSALEAAYGAVPLEEYKAMQAAIPPQPKALEDHSNFREDYSIYNDDHGTVRVSYSGGCHVCHLQVSFDHEIDILEAAGGDDDDLS